MTALLLKQLFTQFVGIGQVAIVGKRDAIRGVDVERLSFRGAGAASRWITHMTDAHVALHTLHVASFKNITHQTVCLTQTEAVICIDGDNASGILTTMLKHC